MITNTTAKSTYTIAEGVTTYAIGFQYALNPDGSPQIQLYLNNHPELPYLTDYELSADGLSVVLIGSSYEVGDRLNILRNIPNVQLSDYRVGRIDPEQIEHDFDEAVMRDQQLQAEIDLLGELPIDHERRIVAIEDVIPAEATSENQLADKAYVDATDSDLQGQITTNKGTMDNHIANVSNPHSVTKAQVGLGNCDNTADLDKPISTATQAALDAHTTRTDNPHSVTKAQVGLGNCDNTSDADKPVSTATQAAIDALTVDDLADVDITSVQEAQVLAYNATAQKWENRTSQMSVAFDGITGNALDNASIASLIAAIYPVGSVYIGTQSTCPMGALISGSTWELVSSGRALWTGNGTNANTTIAAGLPNIEGTFWAKTGYNNQGTGAFSNIQTTGSQGWDGKSEHTQYRLRASNVSSMYGNSSTVQPPAYVVNVWRRTA